MDTTIITNTEVLHPGHWTRLQAPGSHCDIGQGWDKREQHCRFIALGRETKEPDYEITIFVLMVLRFYLYLS